MYLISYILIYPLIKVITFLPFRVLYSFSNILAFLLHKVFRYRLKTVRTNLRLVFPDKKLRDIIKIEKSFYRHFTDISLESIKAYGINENEMKSRYKYDNIEVLKNIQKKSKNIILLCGHYSNFEWLLSIGYNVKGNGYGIYTPMTNKFFDNLFKKIRKKHNAYLISRYQINEFMKKLDKKKFHLFGFASDQSPRRIGKSYINKFLGQKVPIFTGAERFSKEYNLPVVFADVTRVRRGFYKTRFIEIVKTTETEYSITDKFIELLEDQIYRDPTQYFWTHNRFKHLIHN